MRRARRLALTAVVLLAAAGGAWAYFTAIGSGAASASVGTISAPGGLSGNPAAGSVALSWNSVTAPGSGPVSYYVTRNGGAPGGNCASSSSPGSFTSCTDSGLSSGTYQYTVTAVWRSWTATTSTITVTVGSGVLDHFLVNAPASATAGSPFNVTITAQDNHGNTITGYSGTQTLAFSGPANSPSGASPTYPVTITFANGVGTGSVELVDVETTMIDVVQNSIPGQSGSIVVGAGPAASLSLSTPSSATAGTAFSETLTALDAYGNTATGYTGSQPIAFGGLANAPGGAAPNYPASVSFTNGVGTASITPVDAQTSTALTATQGSVTGASGSFAVAAGNAASLGLANPGTRTAGTAFSETITAKDAYGNTATGYSGNQTVSFSGPGTAPGGATPTYPASVSFASGVGTASITLFEAQASTALTATAGSLTGGSGSFAVLAGVTYQIAASASTPQAAGTPFNVTLTAEDQWGNATGSLSGSRAVSFSGLATSPGGVAPVYPATVTFSGGAATASVTAVNAQPTTITVSDPTDGLGGLPSASIAITPGGASSFKLSSPSTAVAGSSFSETVTAADAYGNIATGYTGTQTITFGGLGTSPSGHAPGYPASVPFAAGVGTASITPYDAQTGVTLTAAQSTITGSSSTFTVAGGSASTFSLPTPSTQQAGVAFSETITALDTWGNTASYSGSQALAFGGLGNAPNGATPTYPAMVSFSAGVGSASITPVDAQSSITLTATQATVTGSTGSFSVSGGSAVSFGLTTPSGATAGSSLTERITAYDAYGNTASYSGSQAITFSGLGTSPSGHAPGYPASVPFTAGVGTASITPYDAQTGVTLTAAQSTITGSTSTFTVAAGSASQLAITSAPVVGPTSTKATMGPITVQEQDAYQNPVNAGAGGESVSLSSNSTGTAVFSASSGGTATTTVTIPNGSSSTTFYYGDTKAGTPTITVAHAASPALTSATQQEIVNDVVGLGIVVTGGTGTPVASCGTASSNYTCNVTGVGQAGNVTFYVTFVNANGTPTIYSTTTSSTITESGQNTGSVTIAAGASSSSPNTLTASHVGNSAKTSTLTFGGMTLNVSVGS